MSPIAELEFILSKYSNSTEDRMKLAEADVKLMLRLADLTREVMMALDAVQDKYNTLEEDLKETRNDLIKQIGINQTLNRHVEHLTNNK